LEERELKAIENTKTAIFVRGATCSDDVLKCKKDMSLLKKPHSVTFNKKNDIRPFEDATKVEFFCQKNDSSLFMFGNHNKKRPNNLIIGRMFDYHLLDMVELGVESFTPLQDFKTAKVATGSKPCLMFARESFADPANKEFQRLKSLLIDFFRGPEVTNVRLAGIEHVLQFTAVENKVLLRSYRIILKKSGTRIPRVELKEIGPSGF
jgi:ribosome production factor 2